MKKNDINKEMVVGGLVALLLFSGFGVMIYSTQSNIIIYSNPGKEKYLIVEDTPYMQHLLKTLGVEIVQNYDGYKLVKAQSDIAKLLKSKKAFVKEINYDLGFQWCKLYGKYIPNSLRSTNANGYYVIQLIGPPTAEWRKYVERYGARIIRYVNTYAYLVKMDSDAYTKISSLKFVRSIYIYQPAWKLGKSILFAMNRGLKKTRVVINIDPALDARKVAEKLQLKYNGKNVKVIQPYGPGTYPAKIEMDVSTSLIYKIAKEPYVLAINNRTKLHLCNSVAAQITGAANLWNYWKNGLGVNLTGDGQVVEIADTGLDTGNPSTVIPDFAGRVLTIYDAAGDGDPSDPDNSDLGGHGTHVAGSVASSGVMSGSDPTNHSYYGSFAGMAPEAQIHFESIGTVTIFGGGLNYDSITAMADRGYNDGARIWTNSWGASGNSYDSDADEIDTYMWNHKDFLILFAAGNDGPGSGTLDNQANAKNILAVGASENLRPHVNSQSTWNAYSMSDDPYQLAYFSSRGWAGDGRAKPDIVAPGSGIVSDRPSTLSDSNAGYTWIVPIDSNGDGKYDYGAMQGTSMATPVTAGCAVIVRDFYTDVEGLSNPSAALIKATMIGGAEPLPGYKYGGPDIGFGRVNIARAVNPEPPLSFKYWDWQSADTSASWSTTINVNDSSYPLRIVLVWTDANGGANANPAIVNNLDLKVIAPDGTEYHGNIFNGNSQWSVANPTNYDSLNTTEVVNVQNPAVGTWTIQVIATNIGLDDPDGPGSNDQTFALYALGALGNYTRKCLNVDRKNLGTINTELGNNYTSSPIQLKVALGYPYSIADLNLRVTNYGNSTDTFEPTWWVVPQTTSINVYFNKSSITLSPTDSEWVKASIVISSSASYQLYKLYIGFKSSSSPSILRVLPVYLQVDTNYTSSKILTNNTVFETTSSLAIDPTDNSLWVAFFRQNTSTSSNPVTSLPGNGDNFDLIIAHSTDGGNTWTEYNALPNFNRYFDYNGNLEQIIDWFYWYPSIDVDSKGIVYVAFSTATSVIVVWGDETGWSSTSFESGYYDGTNFLIVYPWVKVYSDSQGNTWVFYTWRDDSAGIRDIREVHTSDGGATWSTPNSIDSTGNANDRRYFPAVAEFGGKLWLFVSQRLAGTAGDSDYYIVYNTYDYATGTWGSFTTLFGTGTDGYYELQPSAFSNGNTLWVAWYSDDDQQNANFGVVEKKIYVMYTSDGSTWNGPIKIDANVPGIDINDYSSPVIGNDTNGNILITFLEENSNYTDAPHNDIWCNYRYSIKTAVIDPTTGSVTEYYYREFAGKTITHPSGESYNGLYYFSYSTYDTEFYQEVYVSTPNIVPYVKIIDPAEKSYVSGSAYINYSALDKNGDTLSINFYYTQDLLNWTTIALSQANTGSYLWDVSSLPDGYYYVKVVATDGNSSSNAVSGKFMVDNVRSPPSVKFIDPLDGYVINPNTTYTIKYNATDNLDRNGYVTSIDIYFSDDGENWSLIAGGLSNTGSYVWQVPDGYFETAYLKIVATDNAGMQANATVQISIKSILYFQVQSSPIVGYKNLSLEPLENTPNEITVIPSKKGDYLVGNWTTDIFTQNRSLNGTWEFGVYAKSIGNIGGYLYAKVYRYNGTLIPLFTTPLDDENISLYTNYHLFKWYYTAPANTFVYSGERIVVQIYMNITYINILHTALISNPTFDTDYSGWSYTTQVISGSGTLSGGYDSTTGNPAGSIYGDAVGGTPAGANVYGYVNWTTTFTHDGTPVDYANLSFDRFVSVFSSSSTDPNRYWINLTIPNGSEYTIYPVTDITGADTSWVSVKNYAVDTTLFTQSGTYTLKIVMEISAARREETKLYMDNIYLNLTINPKAVMGYDYSSTPSYVDIPSLPAYTISLQPGWNLISIPYYIHTLHASDIGLQLETNDIISKYDPITGNYSDYIVGVSPSSYDFLMPSEYGYWIWVNTSKDILVFGSTFTGNITVNLLKGWNLIGWVNFTAIKASQLANYVVGGNATLISIWNSSTQQYEDYLPGISPPSYDFYIYPGMGFWIYVDADCYLEYTI